MPFKACQIIVNSTPTDVKQRQGVPTEWENKNLELLDKKTNTLFAWTQFKANQPSNKASAVGSKDPITKKDKMSILATGKQYLGLFASDLYKMSSPPHSPSQLQRPHSIGEIYIPGSAGAQHSTTCPSRPHC